MIRVLDVFLCGKTVGNTHIVAPPDSRIVRATDPAAVAGSGPVRWLPINATQVADTILNAVTVGDGEVEADDPCLACLDLNLAALELLGGHLWYFVRGINLLEILDDFLDGSIDMVQRSIGAGLDFPFDFFNSVAIKRCLETLDLSVSKASRGVSLMSSHSLCRWGI